MVSNSKLGTTTMEMISSICPDPAENEVLFGTFSQGTASIALSANVAAVSQERLLAKSKSLEGFNIHLAAAAARRESVKFSEDAGHKVIPEQLPYWSRLSNWFEGRVLGLNGLPVGVQSAMDYRVMKDAESLMNEPEAKVSGRGKQAGLKADSMAQAVARCNDAGESEEVPKGWLDRAVVWAEDRIVFLEGPRALWKPTIELKADVILVQAWLART
jgi:hypothetical protein